MAGRFSSLLLMALTAYQTQFKWRMKRAIKLCAKVDQKTRRYTQLLADAIGAAEDAAMQMNEPALQH
ncbi:MAG: hypothetical protein JWR44_1209 [Hymenobacter sp.]|jgi:hypothetical protein|nr:hypothetical protein [Hymenobacter sp.]